MGLIRWTAVFAGSLYFALSAPLPAQATPVSGVLNTTQGSLSISATGIELQSAPVTGTGNFASLGSSSAAVQTLNLASPPVADFLTIATAPNLHFNVTAINPGPFGSADCGSAPAAGQLCSVPGSPLSLINTASGSMASFIVTGTMVDGNTGASTPFTATFTTQFANQSYQEVLATIIPGGSVASSYSAEIITSGGTFSLGGSVNLSNAQIGFGPNQQIGGLTTPGAFVIDPTSTGTFAPLATSWGIAQGISAPVDTPVSVADFLIFAADPTITATLTELSSGIFNATQCGIAPAAGQTCTLTGSALSLMNLAADMVALAFDVSALMESSTGEVTPYAGVITAQFAGMNFQTLLAALLAGGSVNALYSASFAPIGAPTSVPEPATMLLLGVGLATMLAGSRKPRRV